LAIHGVILLQALGFEMTSSFLFVEDSAMSVPSLSQPGYPELTIENKKIFDEMQDEIDRDRTANDHHRMYTDVHAVDIDNCRGR
jgi:hypothetical protein